MALLNSNKIATQKNLYDAGYKGWNSNTSYAESYGNKCVTFKEFNAKDHRDLDLPSVSDHYVGTKSVAGDSLSGNNFTKKVYIGEIEVVPGCEYNVTINVSSYYYHSASSGSGGEFKVSVCIGSKVHYVQTWHTSGSTRSTNIVLGFSNINNEWSSTSQRLDIYLQTSNQTTNTYDAIYFTGSTTISNKDIKDGRKCIKCSSSPGVASAQTVSESIHKGNPCTFSIFRDNVTFTILSRIYLDVHYQLTNGGEWTKTQIANLELGDSASKIYAGNTESKNFYFPVNPIVTGSTGVNECYNSYLRLTTDTTNQNQSRTYFINGGNAQTSLHNRACTYEFSGKYKDTIKTITSFKVRVV